jgi:hypothetical protein
MTYHKRHLFPVLSISRGDVAYAICGEGYRVYGPQWWPLQLTDEQMQAIAVRMQERLKTSRSEYWVALLDATLDVVDHQYGGVDVEILNVSLRKVL